MELFKKLNQEEGVTIMQVTHYEKTQPMVAESSTYWMANWHTKKNPFLNINFKYNAGMQYYFLQLMVLLLLSVAFTASGQNMALTLKQCVDVALENNIPLKQTELMSEAARADWTKAKANLLPDLNGNWGYGWNQGRAIDPFTNTYIDQKFNSSGAGINAGITLFSGLQLQHLIRQMRYAYQASELEWQQSKDKLTLDVMLAFLTVLNIEDNWTIMKEQAAVTRKNVERLSVMVEKGAIGTYQLTDMKGQSASDELWIINTFNLLQTAKLNLAQLMNIPFNPEMQLERINETELLELYPSDPLVIYANALKNLAQVKAVNLRLQSSEKAVQVARAGSYPIVRFNGIFNTNYSSISHTLLPTTIIEQETGYYVQINGDKTPVFTQHQNYDSRKINYNQQFKNNIGTYFGFSVGVPIFNNLHTATAIKKAKLAVKNAAYEADYTKLVLRQSIEKAHQDMTAAYEKYKVLQQQVVDYKESFRAAEVRFELGTIVSTEYLLTKNNYDRARLNLTQTWYEYIFRTRILDFYQGRLNM